MNFRGDERGLSYAPRDMLSGGGESVIRSTFTALAALAGLIAGPGFAQATHSGADHDLCVRDNRDTFSLGCHVVATREVGRLTPEVYWHVDGFADRASAEAAAGPKSVVAEAYGKAWLMTIAAADWRARTGRRLVSVGPLPVDPGRPYTAQFMAATFEPGMHSQIHTHPGPEAWVVLEGAQCLETPEGATALYAGQSAVVRGETPMILTAVGATRRRALALILHESDKPATLHGVAWRPKGLCR
jgi:quercetin dioxygenase-like cupin family protein